MSAKKQSLYPLLHPDHPGAMKSSLKPRFTREQKRDMADAHAEGLHDELPREGCPECEAAS